MLALVPFAAWTNEPQATEPMKVMQHDGIRFVSGGVGQEEQQELAEQQRQFSLQIEAVRPDGAFLGPVDVRIERPSGDLVLDTHTAGPILLVDLSPGTYRVRAEEAGHRPAGDMVRISESGTQTIVLKLEAKS
jgi:hypothetical protein